MQIQVNTDHHVHGREEFLARVSAKIESSLGRFQERITRVEAHLTDVNGAKGGVDDKRCLLEARINGLPPIAVSHQAGTLDQALASACDKMERSIESHLGRLRHHS